jgi:hypothetical protein
MTFSHKQIILLASVIPLDNPPWDTVENILIFLLRVPEAQYQILAEVQRRSQGISQKFIIRHHRLPLRLFVHSWDNNGSLLCRISMRLALENL